MTATAFRYTARSYPVSIRIRIRIPVRIPVRITVRIFNPGQALGKVIGFPLRLLFNQRLCNRSENNRMLSEREKSEC